MLAQFGDQRVYNHLVLRSENRSWLTDERVFEVVDEIALEACVLQNPAMIGSKLTSAHNRAPQNQTALGKSLWRRRKFGLSQARIPSREKRRAMRIDNGQLHGTGRTETGRG